MNGHGKLYYESGKVAYDGLWYMDEFHGRGKVYTEEPAPLKNGVNYHSLDEY